MTAPADLIAPDAETILRLAEFARDGLPEEFQAGARQVRIVIEEMADADLCIDMDIDDPYELTGLYEGIPMTEKEPSFPQVEPDRIILYRRAILDEWCARGDVSLGDLVTNVLVHEMAHHFGWSDEQIADIDKWWE